MHFVSGERLMSIINNKKIIASVDEELENLNSGQKKKKKKPQGYPPPSGNYRVFLPQGSPLLASGSR